MLRDIIGFGIIALVYLCFLILIFTPTIYAAWLYLVARKLTTKRKGVTKLLFLHLLSECDYSLFCG